MNKEEKSGFNWTIAVILMVVTGIMGFIIAPNGEVVDTSKYVNQINDLQNRINDINGELTITKVSLSDAEIKLAGITSRLTENKSKDSISDNVWVSRAWDQIINEFDNSDDFYTCGGHEFNSDEANFKIETKSVTYNKNGNVAVELKVQFTFEDSSDERDCKLDHSFAVSWDKRDIQDEDWNEATIKWINR